MRKIFLALSLISIGLSANAQAQSYPNQPIKLINHLNEYIKSEVAKWGPIVKKSGATAE